MEAQPLLKPVADVGIEHLKPVLWTYGMQQKLPPGFETQAREARQYVTGLEY